MKSEESFEIQVDIRSSVKFSVFIQSLKCFFLLSKSRAV